MAKLECVCQWRLVQKRVGLAGDVTVKCLCKNEVTSTIAKNFVLLIISGVLFLRIQRCAETLSIEERGGRFDC